MSILTFFLSWLQHPLLLVAERIWIAGLLTNQHLVLGVVCAKMARSGTIARTDEHLFFNQHVWYEVKNLFNFYESLLYLRADDRAVLAEHLFPAVVDLKLMVSLDQVNLATTMTRTKADAHEVTILVTGDVSFKLW